MLLRFSGLIKFNMKIIKEWKELRRENILFKYGRRVDKVIFELPNGKEADFYLRDKDRRFAAVLALTKDNKIILAKQFRPGPKKIILELPGGIIEEKETPIEGAKREFLEESGYTGDLEFVGESMVDAYSEAIKYNFVAKNCYKIQESSDTDKEITEVVLMDIEEFRKNLKTGQLSDIETAYFGLDYLKLL